MSARDVLFLTSALPSPCKGCFCVSEWEWARGAVGEGSKRNGLVGLLPGEISLGVPDTQAHSHLGALPEVVVRAMERT